MGDPPDPGVKGLDLISAHSVKNVANDLARKILGIAAVGQAFAAETKYRFDIRKDLVFLQAFLLLMETELHHNSVFEICLDR